MPGMIMVSQSETFEAALFLGSAQKMKFGTEDPDISAGGERKYSAEVAVTYQPEFGRKAVSEVISVSFTGTDPGATITAGTPVEFDRLRCSVSAPEMRDNGRGPRVSGGRLYWVAAGIRAASNGHKPLASVKADGNG